MPRRRKVEKAPRRVRGTGSISIAADGTIRARLPARIDARRPAREFRPGHLADAVAWLDSYLSPQAAPAIDVGAVTLGDWSGSWWQTYVAAVRAPNTAHWYRYGLQQLAALYDTPLADLRPSMLQAVLASLTGRVDPPTVQGIVGVWRRCLEAAVDDSLIARNPAKSLTLPRAAPRSVRRHVTPVEARLLLAAIVGHRFEAAYAILLGCGLRIGEVLGLSWEHVDLAGRRAWIQRQWTNGHWREVPKGLTPRWITLPPAVVAALIRHHNAQPAGAVLVMQSPHTAPRRGKRRDGSPRPWSRNQVAADLAVLVAGLELPVLTPHAARRGLVTALLDGGVPVAEVAGRVGHADPHVTLKSYAGRSDDAGERADRLTDAYLGGNDGQIAKGTAC